MYQSVPGAATAGPMKHAALWPLAGICCLLVLGLVFAATIILALIPIYTANKSVYTNSTGSSANQPFYLQYSADVSGNSTTSGSITNTAQIQSTLNSASGLSNEVQVVSADAQVGTDRRKRHISNHRTKRGAKLYIVLTCIAIFKSGCQDSSCRQKVYTRVLKAVQTVPSLPNLPITVGGVSQILQMSFNGQFTSKPPRFGGPSSTFNFIAIASGLFTDPSTWANGIVPYGLCTVTIPPGITVSLTRAQLELSVRTINVRGTLVLGGPAFSSFTFNYPTNLITYPGGSIQDKTSGNLVYASPSSVITIYPGGNFAGTNTAIKTYSQLPAASNIIASSSLGSTTTGPFTCGLLPSGQILTYPKVKAIAVTSGDFTSSGTWLGGIIPTAAMAALAGGLGMYVAPSCVLSTAGLNGIMNVPFDTVEVAPAATMNLGTPGLTSGFQFGYPVQITSTGIIANVVGVASSISFPVGSVFNMYQSSSFISTGVTTIVSTAIGTGLVVGTPLTLITGTIGPYYINIPLTGVITFSLTVPATVDTGATTAPTMTGSMNG